MVSRLDPPRPIDTDSSPPDVVGGWIGALRATLRVPDGEREAICTEIEGHLRERVRDLVLGGTPESDAIRLALEELGDASALAASLQHARRPWHRSHLMHLLAFGLGAAVITVGTVVTMPGAPAERQFDGTLFSSEPGGTELSEAMLTIEQPGITIDFLLDAIDEATELPLVVDRLALESCGLDFESEVPVRGRMSALRGLEKIAQVGRRELLEIDWRVDTTMIEVAPAEIFDEREVEFVSYGVAPLLEAMGMYDLDPEEAAAKIIELVHGFVTPDLWNDNGGNLGRIRLVGPRLFVQAPRRAHAAIRWILGELAGDPSLGLAAPEEQPGGFGAGRGAPGGGGAGGALGRGSGSVPPSSVIRPGEIVTIRVYDLDRPGAWSSISRRVDDTGSVSIPLLGVVELADCSVVEAESRVRNAAATVLRDPRVMVLREGESAGTDARGR